MGTSSSIRPFPLQIQQTFATRIQFIRVEDTREASAGNLGQDPRALPTDNRGPTDTDRVCFGGYLVDGTQPTAPLLLGLDTQQKL